METLKLLTDTILQFLAGYLEFVFDLVTLHGLDGYVLSNKVNTTLLAYFLIGCTIAYILMKGTSFLGLLSHSSKPDESSTHDKMLFGVLVLRVFAYAIFSHVILLGLEKIEPSGIGTMRDSLNSWLASSAAAFPLSVIVLRLDKAASVFLHREQRVSFPDPFSGWRAPSALPPGDLGVGIFLTLLSMVIGVVLFVYHGLVLAHFHRVNAVRGLLPGLFFFSVAAFCALGHKLYKKLQSARIDALYRDGQRRRHGAARESSLHTPLLESAVSVPENRAHEPMGADLAPNPIAQADG